eukprot:4192827-Alexandrium_andersonii.AAC.1
MALFRTGESRIQIDPRPAWPQALLERPRDIQQLVLRLLRVAGVPNVAAAIWPPLVPQQLDVGLVVVAAEQLSVIGAAGLHDAVVRAA